MNKVFTDNGWKDYVYWQTEDRKTLKKIKFPAFIQLKMDGTYREIHEHHSTLSSYFIPVNSFRLYKYRYIFGFFRNFAEN